MADQTNLRETPQMPLEDGIVPDAFGYIFETCPLGLCIVNDDLSYVEVNAAWCQMLGYSRDELVNRSFIDVTHPEDRMIDQELSRKLFEGRIPFFEIEKRWIRCDGTILSGRLIASVLRKDGCRPWGIAIIEPLDQEDPCDQSLKSTENVIAEFARGTAHDLNNVLFVIGMNVGLLEDQFGENRSLSVIQAARERAAQLTRGLLAAGRPEPIGQNLCRVEEVVDRLQIILEQLLPKNIHIETAISIPDACVPLSPIQLDQILMNLVINARDAMPDGGTITLRVSSTSDDVTIEVQDEGEGIPMDFINRVFEPSFTTKPEERGSGMGLAIVKSITDKCGGQVSVESEIGTGTAFQIILPRIRKAA